MAALASIFLSNDVCMSRAHFGGTTLERKRGGNAGRRGEFGNQEIRNGAAANGGGKFQRGSLRPIYGLGDWLVNSNSNELVVIGALILWQLAPRNTECEATGQVTILGQHHPVKDVLALECESLTNLMPLL